MEEKRFSKEQLLESKTFEYSKDLINCVLEDGKEYTKVDALSEIKKYLSFVL